MQDPNTGTPPYGQAVVPRSGGFPRWLLIVLSVFGAIAIAACGGVVWLAVAIGTSPDTFVYSGNQIPAAYIDSAQNIGIVDPSEQVLFFYSDAMFDVEQAMYVLTDQHLVLYNKSWSDPKRVIAFNEISAVSASWSSEWITDSMISVELTDGSRWTFPLSMENDTDHRFVETLCQSAGVPTPP